MAEEKKVLEFEELTPEQQDDIRKELEEAIIMAGSTEADLWESDAAISENVERIKGVRESIDKEGTEILRMPRGRERAERAHGQATAVRDLTDASLNQVRSAGEFSRNLRALGTQRPRLEELRRKARLV